MNAKVLELDGGEVGRAVGQKSVRNEGAEWDDCTPEKVEALPSSLRHQAAMLGEVKVLYEVLGQAYQEPVRRHDAVRLHWWPTAARGSVPLTSACTQHGRWNTN
tara:strand:- start:1401 stop:1712 length:312 start_codon:yes stop_codon:yes gene_type:complete